MKKIALNVLRILVVVGAIWILFATQDINSLLLTLKQVKPMAMLISLCVFWFANVLIGFRWRYLLKVLDIHVGIVPALKLTFIGLFYNNLMLSAIGGDLLRGWYITQHTDHRKLEAAFSVIIDRACGLTASFILAAAGLFICRDLFTQTQSEQAEGGNGAGIIIKILIGLFLFGLLVCAVLYKTGYYLKIWALVREKVLRIFDAAKIYFRRPLALLFAILFSVLIQLISIFAIYIVCSAANITAEFKYYVAFFPLCWVIASIPISPGGLGVLELGVSTAFLLLPQITPEQALTIAICQRLIFILGALPGGVIHISGTHLPSSMRKAVKNSDFT